MKTPARISDYVHRTRSAAPAAFRSVPHPGRRGPKNKRFGRFAQGVLWLHLSTLSGCEGLAIHDTSSLLIPSLQRSEIIGLLAGFGTTFAAVPDLIRMFKRRSSKGMNPTMAGIMGVFQILWIYYGLLIMSRPVVVWNVIAVIINFMTVGAYFLFGRSERLRENI